MTEHEPTGETSSDGQTTGPTASGATPDRVGIGDGHIRLEAQGGCMGTHRLPNDAGAVASRTTATERADRGGHERSDGRRRPAAATSDESLDRPSAGGSTRRP